MEKGFYDDERWNNDMWAEKAWEQESKTINDKPIIGWGLLLLPAILFLIGLWSVNIELLIFSVVFFFITAPIFIIVSAVQSARLIKKAKKYNIPPTDEKVIKAETTLVTTIVGAANFGKQMTKSIKSSVSNLSNPDKWKKI